MAKYDCKLTFPGDIEVDLTLDGDQTDFTVKVGDNATSHFTYRGGQLEGSRESGLELTRASRAFHFSPAGSTGGGFTFESTPPIKDPPVRGATKDSGN